jgi:hypothetical protein
VVERKERGSGRNGGRGIEKRQRGKKERKDIE